MQKTRLGWFFLGVLLLIIGFLIYSHKGWSLMRGASTHHTLGYVFIIGGLIYCFFTLLKKDFPKDTQVKEVICTSCLTPFYNKDLSNSHCPKCNGVVDDLKGFYKKHPELKNKDRT